MRPHSIIIDDFLPDFSGWRIWADTAKYVDEINPIDGVTYPGICAAVPSWGTQMRLQGVMGSPVKINALFMRLSLEGISVPHQAHHDGLMGQYSLMLYLNRPEHCQGGTSLIEHVDGEPDERVWLRDTNQREKWRIKSMCEMRSNRAFIFRSDLWHRAEPIGGYGTDATNGRLVMTAFFSL